MSFNFTPTDDDLKSIRVPYLEDARADFAPYYSVSGWTVTRAQTAVINECAKLGAAVLRFQEGWFDINKQRRLGYLIEFVLQGNPGRMPIAGLPTRGQLTDAKRNRVRVQALLNVRDWIKASVTARVFSPGTHPLIPYLLTPGGETVAERLERMLSLPRPADVAQLVEGELVDE